MKRNKFSIILVMCLVFGWFMFFVGMINNNKKYEELMEKADESMEKKLYMQAVEDYEAAYKIKDNEEIYAKIFEAYTKYIKELKSTPGGDPYDTQVLFATFLENAVMLYADEEEYWTELIELKLEQNSYKTALSYANKAKDAGMSSKDFDKLYDKVYYMIEEKFEVYQDYSYAGGEYYTVSANGSSYTILSLSGEKILEGYEYAGPVSVDGYFLAQNTSEAYISDIKGVIRGRFDYKVDEAGYYSADVDLLPIRIDDEWSYVNKEGEEQFGAYDYAGTFINGVAAVQEDDEWYLIDKDGEKVSDETYEDIKLGMSGSYIVDGIMVVKEDGKYKLLDSDMEQISDFECDDIDSYVGNDYIAYEEDGKWGFVDKEGNVVQEPEYAGARSFSNGFAAVCNKDGEWGFVNKEFKLAIKYRFEWASYFDSSFSCMISKEEAKFKMIKFKNS